MTCLVPSAFTVKVVVGASATQPWSYVRSGPRSPAALAASRMAWMPSSVMVWTWTLRKVSPGPGAELVEVPVPEPGEGEILVRVHAASVCGTDLHIYDWNEWAAARIRTPMTFGHELAGHVDAVGPEVHHIQPGTFVAAETHIACG